VQHLSATAEKNFASLKSFPQLLRDDVAEIESMVARKNYIFTMSRAGNILNTVLRSRIDFARKNCLFVGLNNSKTVTR
jgi:hypothetical protein